MPLGRLQQLKIWSGDTVFRWHAVIITYDSITGVPYKMSTKCDSLGFGCPQSTPFALATRPALPKTFSSWPLLWPPLRRLSISGAA